jgi:hypothetical protein
LRRRHETWEAACILLNQKTIVELEQEFAESEELELVEESPQPAATEERLQLRR